ncbi:hemagglutinin repeat-containing protein [Pseudomonas abieticivorans]|uniref:hemagglutinin repeat-containing protein n=1 Tax=Pseudomonas abieticivorans TaxID=2931382 RepID=UPI0020BFB542|nr:hemagglutinin repeat-containing protein [Pseudomonas sp. PIA16]
MTRTTTATLLTPNRLRWAISAALLTYHLPTLADGLTPQANEHGIATVFDHNGTPSIDIVKPNDQGVSHNGFLDYNVAEQGLLLNNALQGGESAMGPILERNSHFTGQAASTIVLEVTGFEASNILGDQQIFGQRADYVLANPNGITLNGAGVINANRASFLVGTPLFEDGRLARLDASQARGTMSVGKDGVYSAQGALDLITPVIETQGATEALGDLNLIIGHNTLGYADNRVLATAAPNPANPPVDAHLLGAMRAGRISVVSTTEGAGVRMPGTQIDGRDGVHISSRGALSHTGSTAANGKVSRASLNSQGDVLLTARDDLTLTAVQLNGANIQAKAGKRLTIDALTREKIGRENKVSSSKAWFIPTEEYSSQRTQTETQVVGSQIKASGDITLTSGDDILIAAADLDAPGTLKAEAGKRISIEARINRTEVNEQTSHRKYLWRGDSSSNRVEETAKGSQLNAGSVELTGGTGVAVQGSDLDSQGNLQIRSGGQVLITSTALNSTGERQYKRGDLVGRHVFGQEDSGKHREVEQQRSRIKAGGSLDIASEDVRIQGSSVHGTQGATVTSTSGQLRVEGVQVSRENDDSTLDNRFIGLFSDRSTSKDQTSTHKASELGSDHNLSLRSPDQVVIQGSNLTAGGTLAVSADKGLSITPGEDRRIVDDQASQRRMTAEARETKRAEDGKPGSKQYDASVGFQVKHSSDTTSTGTAVASQLDARTIDLAGGEKASLTGARLNSADSITITAEQIDLLASKNVSQTLRSDSTSSGKLAVTGGMDRLGSAFQGEYQKDESTRNDTTHTGTQLTANGDIALKGKAITNQATKIDTPGALTIDAANVTQRAAIDEHQASTTRTTIKGSLGASLEYNDLTRPIENVVNGDDQYRFQQQALEDNLYAPSLGADLIGGYQQRSESTTSTQAKVTDLKAGQLAMVVENTLIDEATRYQSTQSPLKLTVGEHDLRAVANSETVQLKRMDADARLRVETNTGTDLNAKIVGAGGSLDKTTASTTAVVGSLVGNGGIQVQLGTDGRYEGTALKSTGDIVVNAPGNLTFAQADNRQSLQQREITGSAWLKGGNSPTAGKSMGGSAIGKFNDASSADSQAQVARFETPGTVRLNAGKDLRLEGVLMGSVTEPVKRADTQAGGQTSLLAAADTHQAEGRLYGGGLQASGSRAKESTGGGLGASVEFGRTHESSRTLKGAEWYATDTARLGANSADDAAVLVEGAQLNAKTVQLEAPKGGVVIESALSSETRDNKAVGVGMGLNGSKTGDAKTDTSALHARATLDLDKLDSQTHGNARVRADALELNSRNDVRLSGVQVNADRVSGRVGNDLIVESRQDQVNALKVQLDARLNAEKNPQGLVNGASALAGPAAGKLKEKAGAGLKKADQGFAPTLGLEVERQVRDTVGVQTVVSARDGINLEVGGDTRLAGALLKSTQGPIELAGSDINTTTLSGNDHAFGLKTNLSLVPEELTQNLMEAFNGKPDAQKTAERTSDLGLFKTSGHDRSQALEGGVKHKEG